MGAGLTHVVWEERRARSGTHEIVYRMLRRNLGAAAQSEPDELPPWAMSSVLHWLTPFLRGAGMEAQGSWDQPGRDFVREIERTQRLRLDWSGGPASAQEDLWQRLHREQTLLVNVLTYACSNVLLGYTYQDYREAGARLDRELQQAGTVWEGCLGPRAC